MTDREWPLLICIILLVFSLSVDADCDGAENNPTYLSVGMAAYDKKDYIACLKYLFGYAASNTNYLKYEPRIKKQLDGVVDHCEVKSRSTTSGGNLMEAQEISEIIERGRYERIDEGEIQWRLERAYEEARQEQVPAEYRHIPPEYRRR